MRDEGQNYNLIMNEVEKTQHSMKWFYFVLYVQLPLGILFSIACILNYILRAKTIYFYPHIFAYIFAILINLAVIVLSYYTFIYLRGHKKGAKLFLAIKIAAPSVIWCFNFLGMFIFSAINYALKAVYIAEIGLLVLIAIAEIFYFRKRKYIFADTPNDEFHQKQRR